MMAAYTPTEAELVALAEWVEGGGEHHGPIIETVIMPLAKYVEFRNRIRAEAVREARNDLDRRLLRAGWHVDHRADIRAHLEDYANKLEGKD